jgi:hypothetical protein
MAKRLRPEGGRISPAGPPAALQQVLDGGFDPGIALAPRGRQAEQGIAAPHAHGHLDEALGRTPRVGQPGR